MSNAFIQLAVTALLCFTTLNVQATLTTSTNGLGVYSSVSDVTWTQDANLLGSLEGAYQSTSYNTIISAIINANGGVIHDTPNSSDTLPNSGIYTLTAADFGSGGTVNWWGAQAFMGYLNSINYDGSSQWMSSPTDVIIDGPGSYHSSVTPLESLYFELLGIGDNPSSPMPSGPFANVNSQTYWLATEPVSIFLPPYFSPSYAWFLSTQNNAFGTQDKTQQFYAWAMSPGQVPLPGAVWLMGSGLLWLLGLKRRGKAG